MKCIRTALIACATLLASAPALAQGFYFGASAGQSSMYDVPAIPVNFNGEDTAFKVFGGYQFGKYVAIEAFYADFGEPADGAVSIDAAAYGVEAVVILPIVDRLLIFGKAGIAAWDADFIGPLGFSDDGLDPVFGGGLAVKITPSVAIRGEWEFFQIHTDVGGFDVDTQLLSAGVQFNF